MLHASMLYLIPIKIYIHEIATSIHRDILTNCCRITIPKNITILIYIYIMRKLTLKFPQIYCIGRSDCSSKQQGKEILLPYIIYRISILYMWHRKMLRIEIRNMNRTNYNKLLLQYETKWLVS